MSPKWSWLPIDFLSKNWLFRKLNFYSIKSFCSKYRGFQIRRFRIFGQKERSNRDSNPSRLPSTLLHMDPYSLALMGGSIRQMGNMIQMKYELPSFRRPMWRRLKRRRRDEVEKRIQFQNMGYYWRVSTTMVTHLLTFHQMSSLTSNHHLHRPTDCWYPDQRTAHFPLSWHQMTH